MITKFKPYLQNESWKSVYSSLNVGDKPDYHQHDPLIQVLESCSQFKIR